jgi:excinuclease ABC subunit A
MPTKAIYVKGAREHNLKDIDVEIPRDQLVVITGVSGSGKSSLAFDTIYAEGQRRYVESLSAYARQFLGRMEKPDVEYIEGLSPAISIDQKGVSHNPRSTVGTVTEVYDYLRLLYARIGHPHCPNCGRPIERQTVQQIVDAVLELPVGTRILVLGPLVRDRKGEHQGLLDEARHGGFVRARVDGTVLDLSESIILTKNKRHTVEVVVDRLVVPEHGSEIANRIADSVETALKLGSGAMQIADPDGDVDDMLFSEHFACVHCGISVGELEPRTFSFNSPHGACPECTGLGFKLELDPNLIIPNKELSLADGAISPWRRAGTMAPWYASILKSASSEMGFSADTPVKDLDEVQLRWILYGDRPPGTGEERKLQVQHHTRRGRTIRFGTSFEGVIPNMARRYKDTDSEYMRTEIERFMTQRPCPVCEGKRLKPEVLGATIDGRSIVDTTALTIDRGLAWAAHLEQEGGPLSERERMIAFQILKEIASRLNFLVDVGLEYLTMDRSAATLSGGEGQRIRLATQIGSGLMGVLYICDEPSIGLHPVDNQRLIETLKRLRDLGNTVLVVEHDEALMRAADHIVDMGPGAGEHGGRVVAAGVLDDIIAAEDSMTGAYLSGRRSFPVPEKRRKREKGRELSIRGARQNNLKNQSVKIPLGLLVCVTGVSGSGKSTLVHEILYKKLAQTLYQAREIPGTVDRVDGLELIDKVVKVDQSPIGRTPRSNPATYVGAFTSIREIFAATPEARMRGYAAGRFSFNVKGGRCETCRGDGYQLIEMQFLPDVTVPCEVCKGARYNREALEIQFKGHSIADVLDMTVAEAATVFEAFPRIGNRLKTMVDVGLGYMRLGQPATTLSGGEAQRVKLATELSKRATGRTLYILDEPTTGLSFADAHALMDVLQRLVDSGNTVLLIEHHLDMIKNADWIIDLGPGPGDRGGQVIAEGTPERVAAIDESFTGQYLKNLVVPEVKRARNGSRANGKSKESGNAPGISENGANGGKNEVSRGRSSRGTPAGAVSGPPDRLEKTDAR